MPVAAVDDAEYESSVEEEDGVEKDCNYRVVEANEVEMDDTEGVGEDKIDEDGICYRY